MNCPNCGNELHIDETQQTITCECGKVYKNPMYRPPIEEKKMVLKEKKTVKSKLPYILIIVTMVLVVASLVVGSVCLATLKPVTGVAMAKKMQKAGYDVVGGSVDNNALFYPADTDGRMVTLLMATKKDSNDNEIEVQIYYFTTQKSAKAYYDERCNQLNEDKKEFSHYKDYIVGYEGRKVFYGNKDAVRDATK